MPWPTTLAREPCWMCTDRATTLSLTLGRRWMRRAGPCPVRMCVACLWACLLWCACVQASLALLAAHDVASAMHAGLLPPRPVHLYTQGKPRLGPPQLRESLQAMLRDGSHLKTVRRHVLGYGRAVADPVAELAAQARMGWVHETTGLALQCPVAATAALSPRCHSVAAYASELHSLANETATLGAACASRLPPPFRTLNLCGPSLESATMQAERDGDTALAQCLMTAAATHAVDAPVAAAAAAAALEAAAAAAPPALASLDDRAQFLLRLGIVTLSWLVAHLVLVVVYSWALGRPHPLRGPFFTGYVGFGDGSTAPKGLIERALLASGLTSANPSLYFVEMLAVGRLAPPVRIPPLLAAQGFRGRSDDATRRFPEASLAHGALGQSAAQSLRSKGSLRHLHMQAIGPRRSSHDELPHAERELATSTPEQRRGLHLLRLLLERRPLALAELLVPAPGSAPDSDETRAISSARLISLMSEAQRRWALRCRLRGLLRRSLWRERSTRQPVRLSERLSLLTAFQAADHSRENFVSATVAACMMILGLAQVRAPRGAACRFAGLPVCASEARHAATVLSRATLYSSTV